MEQEKQNYVDKWIKSRALNKVPKVIPEKLFADKEFVIEVLRLIPLKFPLLKDLPPKTQKDKDVIKEAAKCFSLNAFYAPKEVRNDKDLILFLAPYASKSGSWGKYYFSADSFVKSLPDSIRDDKQVRAAYLAENPSLLDAFYPKRWCDDRDDALLVLPKWGFGIHLLSQRLRDDKELVMMALGEEGANKEAYVCEQSLLRYVSDRLRDDKDVVLLAMRRFGLGLTYASDRLKDDKDVALAAVAHRGEKDKYDVEEHGCRVECSYDFVSPRFKADREVALVAVTNNPWAYYFAPATIKRDFEIALTAFNNYVNPGQLNVPAEFLDDKSFVLQAIQNGSIKYASLRLKNDKDVALAALKHQPEDYRYLSFERQKDPELILLAAKDGLSNLYPANRRILKREGEYILEVNFNAQDILRAANIIKAFSGFGSNAEERKEIVQIADGLASHANHEDATIEVEVDEELLVHAIKPADAHRYPKEVFDDDALMIRFIQKDSSLLSFASDRLKDDRDFMLKALDISYYGARYASDRLKDDDDYARAIIDAWNASVLANSRHSIKPVEFLSPRLKADEEFLKKILP